MKNKFGSELITKQKLLPIFLMTGILALMIPTGAPLAVAGDDGRICDNTHPVIGETIPGDVKIPSGATCFISLSTIGGNVQGETGPDTVKVFASDIGGNVQLKGATGDIDITHNNVGGNIQISGTDSDGSIVVRENNQPDGNIQLDKNKVTGHDFIFGLSIMISSNNIQHGNIQLVKNSATFGIEVSSNTLAGGDIQLFKNPADLIVVFNTVSGNLQCKENTSVAGAGNTAAAKEDQCAAV